MVHEDIGRAGGPVLSTHAFGDTNATLLLQIFLPIRSIE